MVAFSVPRFSKRTRNFILTSVDVVGTSAALGAGIVASAGLDIAADVFSDNPDIFDSPRTQTFLDSSGPEIVRGFVRRRDQRNAPAVLKDRNVFVGGTPVVNRPPQFMEPAGTPEKPVIAVQETILPPIIAVSEPVVRTMRQKIRAARGCDCSKPRALMSPTCRLKC